MYASQANGIGDIGDIGDTSIVFFSIVCSTTNNYLIPGINTRGNIHLRVLLPFSDAPGNLDNTFPNPNLRRRSVTKSANGGGGQEGRGDDDEYLPAYMLSDWSLERAGRGKRTIDTLACELR